MIVPGNRFEYLEARARALDAIDDGESSTRRTFAPERSTCSAQHILAMACAAPFEELELLAEVRSSAPYAWPEGRDLHRSAELHRHRRVRAEGLRPLPPSRAPKAMAARRIAKPQIAAQHRAQRRRDRRAAAAPVRFRNGRKLGTIEERLCLHLAPGDLFFFAGLSLEVEQIKDT